MEQIKLTQTQALFSFGSAASGSSDNSASVLAFIDERLIVEEVLWVWRGHCKGVGQTVTGKGKASFSSSTFSSRSQSQVEQQRRFDERLYNIIKFNFN